MASDNGGLDAFKKAEPWVDEQIGRRLVGIGHTFPGYTYEVILDLPEEVWYGLARAYDNYVDELERENRKRTSGRQRYRG